MIETKTKKVNQIVDEFKGGKRKLLKLRIFQPDSDTWTRKQMADYCGISEPTLYSYLGDSKLMDALKRCTIMIYGLDLPTVIRANVHLAKKGDPKHTKMVYELTGLTESGNRQTMNVGIHDQPQPATLQIDTPEQLEQAIAQCQAEMATLQELMDNLVAMRAGTGRLRGDGIHRRQDDDHHEEA